MSRAVATPRRLSPWGRLAAGARLVGIWLRAAPAAILGLIAIVGLSSLLATAAPLWFERSAEAALSQQLANAPAGGSGLEFGEIGQIVVPQDADPLTSVAAEGEKLKRQVPASIAGGLGPQIEVIDSLEFIAIGAPQPTTYLTIRIEPGIGDAIAYYAGHPPSARVEYARPPGFGLAGTPTFEVALSRATAEALLVGVGDALELVSVRNRATGNTSLRAAVVGLFDVKDGRDPRWFGDQTLNAPSIRQISMEQFDYHAIALVADGAYAPLVFGPPQQLLTYRWRFNLDPGRPAAVGVEQFSVDLAKLGRAFPFRAGAATPGVAGLSTGLPGILDRYRAQREIAATVVALASAGAVIATAGGLVMIVGALRRRRTGTIRLAKARGADLARLLGIGLLEAALLVVPAAAAGAWLGRALLGGPTGRVDAIGPVLVAIVVAVLLVAAAIGSAHASMTTARERTERTIDARNRRRVLDALVVVVAVAAALSLGSGPAADPAAAFDPIRAGAPALLALAGAILLVRVFDGLVTGLARVARGRRGLVVVHAARSLARGPRTHELPLLVLLVAVASGVFAATVSTTTAATQDLAATNAVGAAYRIQSAHPGSLPPNLDIAALGAIGPTAVDARDIGVLNGIGPAPQPVDVIGIDGAAYEAVTAGTPIGGRLPTSFVAPLGEPTAAIPILVPPGVASDMALGVGTTLQLAIGSSSAPAVVVGVADPIPAASVGRGVLARLDALRRAFPDRTFGATQVFVRAAPGDRPRIEAVLEPYSAGVLLFTVPDALASVRAGPLVDTMATAFVAAQVIAAIFAVIVVGASVAQTLALRSAELSLLRAMGVSGRRAIGIVALELGSTIAVAVGGGLALGLATAAFVVPGLGIERFVGVSVAAAPSADPEGLLLAVAAPVLAGLTALVLLGRAVGRSGIAAWIRSAET